MPDNTLQQTTLPSSGGGKAGIRGEIAELLKQFVVYWIEIKTTQNNWVKSTFDNRCFSTKTQSNAVLSGKIFYCIESFRLTGKRPIITDATGAKPVLCRDLGVGVAIGIGVDFFLAESCSDRDGD